MDYDHHEHKDKHHVILERYEEELEDACEYAKLAEEHPDLPGLWAIGRDEVTHANYLRDALIEHGHEFSEEHERKWHHVLKRYGFAR